MSRGLGRIPQWDDRNLQYLAIRRIEEAPVYVERHTPWKLSGVYDQGDTGTCVAHCGIEGYEATPIGHVKLSWMPPFELYRKIILVDDYPENDAEVNGPDAGLVSGTSVLALMKFFKSKNVIPSYEWLTKVADMSRYVRWTDGGPLFLGTEWLTGMDDPDHEGIVHVTGQSRGGHSYLCYWYDPKRDLFWCLQSWGLSFGVANPWDKRRISGGCFAIPGTEMQQLIDRQGEVAAAREWRRKHIG